MPAHHQSTRGPARSRRLLIVLMATVAILGVVLPVTAQAGGVSLFEFGLEDNGRATAGRYAFADDASTTPFSVAAVTSGTCSGSVRTSHTARGREVVSSPVAVL